MDELIQSPHVVMLVANDVVNDVRVKKSAASAASVGYRVTVLGYSPTGSRTETSFGGATIIRVPSDFRLKNYRKSAAPLRPTTLVAYRNKEELLVAAAKRKVREREIAARITALKTGGPRPHPRFPSYVLTEPTRQLRRVRIRWLRLSLRLHRKIQRVRTQLYRRQIAGTGSPLLLRIYRHFGPRLKISRASWRRSVPELHDFDLAFAPLLDELQPTLIHAHDIPVIGIAARAARRLSGSGQQVRWIYDAHEYVAGMPNHTQEKLAAYGELEKEYISEADGVITVSPYIADTLVDRYGLPRKPVVVLNAPIMDPEPYEGPSVRSAVGLQNDEHLAVYSGGLDKYRGVDTIVRALPQLEGLHVALVTPPTHPLALELLGLARELGCEGRLHTAPYVRPDHVFQYLRGATFGVHTLHHCGNHEAALPNKYFEYMHAGLPIIVSDVQAMAELTTRLGIGEVYRAGDPEDFVRAVKQLLSNLPNYRAALDNDQLRGRYSWEVQGQKLLSLYAELVGPPRKTPARSPASQLTLCEGKQHRTSTPAGPPSASPRLLIGPRNVAGQPWEWARALERGEAKVEVETMGVARSSPLVFPVHVRVPATKWRSLEWQTLWLRHVLSTKTHVLSEAGASVFGTLTGPTFEGDLPLFAANGIRLAIVFHGSEIRDPSVHRELEVHSPFQDPSDELTARLQGLVDDLLPRVKAFPGRKFVTTMDLVDFVPGAEWLPLTVPLDVWTAAEQPLTQQRKPVVLHAPSNNRLKGSAAVDTVARALSAKGCIEYHRLENVPVAEMPRALASADIVLDQFALGDYGVLACQAMAAGRVVVGHVRPAVRARLPEDPPIMEATPDTLEEVLTALLECPDTSRAVAAEGQRYVRQYHSGAMTASRLGEWLKPRNEPYGR